MPQRAIYAARRGVAAAQYRAGGAFFPNAPVATGSYIDDRVLGSRYNYITSQAEIDTPIWLPGEGTATQNVARADAGAVDAAAIAAHLALASEVLGLVARATYAGDQVAVARRRLAVAGALALDASRRYRVGEGSESDSLAAAAEASSARAALSTAAATFASAREALLAVTGQPSIPSLALAPTRALPAAVMLASHPRIAAALRAVAAAQARARLVRIENRDSPQIGLQGINEKQFGSPWDTRFGVVFRLPFATEARNAPRRAAAQEAITRAEVQLDLARRTVLAELREAAGAARAATATAAAAAALERRRGEIERAWRLGEMPLIEVIRADALASDATLAQDRARTELLAARIGMRLAYGVLP